MKQPEDSLDLPDPSRATVRQRGGISRSVRFPGLRVTDRRRRTAAWPEVQKSKPIRLFVKSNCTALKPSDFGPITPSRTDSGFLSPLRIIAVI